MAKPGETGFRRIISALRYSMLGLRACWRREAAFRQESAAFLIFCPLAFYLGESGLEAALLLASCLLVLIVELVNSAIETVVDRIGPERHELSGLAKDLGSSAVLLSLVNFGATWALVIFW